MLRLVDRPEPVPGPRECAGAHGGTVTLGVVATYASGEENSVLPVKPLIVRNARWQFVLLYTVPTEAKAGALEAVSAAARAAGSPDRTR